MWFDNEIPVVTRLYPRPPPWQPNLPRWICSKVTSRRFQFHVKIFRWGLKLPPLKLTPPCVLAWRRQETSSNRPWLSSTVKVTTLLVNHVVVTIKWYTEISIVHNTASEQAFNTTQLASEKYYFLRGSPHKRILIVPSIGPTEGSHEGGHNFLYLATI